MPEGPEYVKLSKDLAPWVGKKLVRIVPHWEGYQKFAKIPAWPKFEAIILNRQIEKLTPYGKNLWVVMEGDTYWRIHLSSTGWIEPIDGPKNPLTEHFLHSVSPQNTRLVFEFSEGPAYRYLDARTWGKFYAMTGRPLPQLLVETTGPSWLVDKKEAWVVLVEHQSLRRVKDVLTDQQLTAGVGNYISCEALFRARIYPHARWNEISLEKRRELAASIIAVMEKSVLAEDHEHWAVFDRRDAPCIRCGTAIAYVKDRSGDRGSYFCPKCQEEGPV